MPCLWWVNEARERPRNLALGPVLRSRLGQSEVLPLDEAMVALREAAEDLEASRTGSWSRCSNSLVCVTERE